MKKKDFKLLIEGFNKFLLKEHIGHTAECTRLFAAIPNEFSDYINENSFWYNGDAWSAGVDHSGNQNAAADHELLFKEVAEALGCLTYKDVSKPDGSIETKPCFENMLVNYADSFRDDFDRNIGDPDVFLSSYVPDGQQSLSGSFKIGNSELRGFYYQLGTSCGLEGQFQDSMSETTLKGLVFVVPNISSSVSNKSKEEVEDVKPKFKSALGKGFITQS